MSVSEIKNFLDVAVNAAKASGISVKQYFLDGDYQISTKSDSSLQTSADVESESQLVERLTTSFPDHGLITEEQGVVRIPNSRYQWFIDPLDGTANFVMRIPYFSISLCLYKDGDPVLGVVFNPLTGQLFTATCEDGPKLNGKRIQPSTTEILSEAKVFIIPNERTQREPQTRTLLDLLYQRSQRLLDTWAPALDWCLVACGKAEGVVVVGDSPINSDVGMLAGMFILHEAQGVITDFQSLPLCADSATVIGSNTSALHSKLLDLIHESFLAEPRTAQ